VGKDAYFCSIAVGDGLLQGNAGLHKGSVLFFVEIKANALLFGVQSGPRSTVPSCAFAGGACGKTSVGHEIDAASADTGRRLAWTDMGRPRERVYLRVSATSHFGSRILRCKTHHRGFLLVSLDVYWL